jgi:hypothetical protein
MLAALLNIPSNEQEWSVWGRNNYDVNAQIRLAILAQKNISLPEYPLDPIPFFDLQTWLMNNQQAHIDFTSSLGQQSSDLISVDLNDENQKQAWIFLNYMELQSACQTLGIGP